MVKKLLTFYITSKLYGKGGGGEFKALCDIQYDSSPLL